MSFSLFWESADCWLLVSASLQLVKVGIILYCEYHVIMFPHPAQTFFFSENMEKLILVKNTHFFLAFLDKIQKIL